MVAPPRKEKGDHRVLGCSVYNEMVQPKQRKGKKIDMDEIYYIQGRGFFD
jgi:hypothetical protein